MKKNAVKKMVCFGEVLWDMLPSGAIPGGAPLNVAIHLKKQGQNPQLISKIGDDKSGEQLLHFLQQAGIDTTFIAKDIDLPTSKVLVHLDANKNAAYEICEPVAWDNIQYNSGIEQLIKDADFLIFGSLASRNTASLDTLLHIIANTEAQKLLDVNLRPPYNDSDRVEKLLQLSDFVKLNDNELKEIAAWHSVSGNEKELIHWFIAQYRCRTLCVTRGERGAVLFYHGNFYEHPGFKVDAVDTVGAGDSFFASLIAELSVNSAPGLALETACATGAFVASQPGAVPEYSSEDIETIKKCG